MTSLPYSGGPNHHRRSHHFNHHTHLQRLGENGHPMSSSSSSSLTQSSAMDRASPFLNFVSFLEKGQCHCLPVLFTYQYEYQLLECTFPTQTWAFHFSDKKKIKAWSYACLWLYEAMQIKISVSQNLKATCSALKHRWAYTNNFSKFYYTVTEVQLPLMQPDTYVCRGLPELMCFARS